MHLFSRNRGAALIVVVCVLAVLALLATTFVTLQALDRKIARNYLDTVRAKLIAQSGVEHAIQELRRIPTDNLILPGDAVRPWLYWGNDVLESGVPAPPCPLKQARNPSFAVEKDDDPLRGSPEPKEVRIEGSNLGYSGVMSCGTYANNSDLYTLKSTDASGKIFVNEGLSQYRGNTSAGSQNLRRILNRLGMSVVPAIPGLGDRIVGSRGAAGYRSMVELKAAMPEAEYERVADFLTVSTWLDPCVVNPVPFTAEHAAALKAEFGIEYYRGQPPVYRFGRGNDYRGILVGGTLKVYPSTSAAAFGPDGLLHAVYAMDELNPQWIETVSRAPVNVNAAPKEVLVALLSDLKGVFLSERRRNNIETNKVGGYHFLKVRHSYSPANMPMPPADERPQACYDVPEGDELGFLYETYPIIGPGSTGSGISASVIADEIIACRDKKKSPAVPGCDYGDTAAVPFGGPFRTWRQFNAFCDNLVRGGVLQDPRPIFYDYRPQPVDYGNITGYAPVVPSDFERQVASQAIADVLKANFNPNVHLNELNPDCNRHLLVDKTDLVVNSTEFIFTPTGYYDIESIGYVMRPESGTDALAAGIDNAVVARMRVNAGVQLFDIVRETRQSQFARGTFSPCSGPATNNGWSLEAGPEPDNGNGPLENDWGGYVAFPTIGGDGVTRAAKGGPPAATPQGNSEIGETIHTHLGGDFDAHYHADGDEKRRDMGSMVVGPGDGVMNYPDPDPNAPAVCGPYDPMDNGGNYYRLARSFEFHRGSSDTTAMPTLGARAPMDLRIDGGYLERHAALAYWISPTSYVISTDRKKGVLAYWMKPNFDPARSGKPRLFANMGRHGKPWMQVPAEGWFKGAFTQANFMQFWNAGHDTYVGDAPTVEKQTFWYENYVEGDPSTDSFGVMPFKPQAMIFGVGYGWLSGYGGVYYHFAETPSLNHLGHLDEDDSRTFLKPHEWMHVILSWTKTTDVQEDIGPIVESRSKWEYKALVNGQLLPGSVEGLLHPYPQYDNDTATDWTVHPAGDRNSLRFGAPSRVVSGTETNYHNFSADSTLDEIYFWNDNAYETAALALWLTGRYSFPKASGEGVFTSAPIKTTSTNRLLPPASAVIPPASPDSPGGSDPASGLAAARLKVLGISWTWFAEGSERAPDGTWSPVLTDHGSVGGTLFPSLTASFPCLPWIPAVADDGYSPLRDAAGKTPEVPLNEELRYRITFTLPGSGLGTVLLTTPVLDDVTVYLDDGEVRLHSYMFDSGSF